MKKNAPVKDSSERWLITYADLMNLLLILFIILYAMSVVNKEKAEKVSESIRRGFGYVENGGTGESEGEGTGLYGADFTETEGNPGADSDSGEESNLYWSQETVTFQKFYDDVIKLIEENNLQTMVDVAIDDRGIVISFKDNVLFASGQAYLGGDSLELIDQIGKMLTKLSFSFILVAGHTDTDPIHTSQYVDNMDLSTQRAANVWRELVRCGLSAEKMASIGYGEYRPTAPNDTPENKAMNRRVVITILRADVKATDELITSGSFSGTDGASASDAEADGAAG